MSLKTSKNKLLFLFKEMSSINSDDKFDLVLTPQLYIIQKSNIPFKYSFQAKKVAPSILEEFSNTPLEYEVLKDNNNWFFIGYDKNEIQALLKKKGIKPHQVGKLLFAQQFKEQLKEHPLILGDKEALGVIDEIVTFAPLNIFGDISTISIDFLKKPKKTFSIKIDNKNIKVDPKLAVYLSIIMGLFGFGWWLDGLKINKTYNILDEKLASQLSQYPSLQSSIARENIYKKYEKIDKKQRAIREFLKGIGKLITKESKVISLKIDNKTATATINIEGGYLNRIKSLAKSLGFNVYSKSSTTIVVQRNIL